MTAVLRDRAGRHLGTPGQRVMTPLKVVAALKETVERRLVEEPKETVGSRLVAGSKVTAGRWAMTGLQFWAGEL